MEPPPSPPVPSVTIPPATAAALPPDEPPGVSSRFHGLRSNTVEFGCRTVQSTELTSSGEANQISPSNFQALNHRSIKLRNPIFKN